MLKIIMAEGLTTNIEIEGGFWNFYSIEEIDREKVKVNNYLVNIGVNFRCIIKFLYIFM